MSGRVLSCTLAVGALTLFASNATAQNVVCPDLGRIDVRNCRADFTPDSPGGHESGFGQEYARCLYDGRAEVTVGWIDDQNQPVASCEPIENLDLVAMAAGSDWTPPRTYRSGARADGLYAFYTIRDLTSWYLSPECLQVVHRIGRDMLAQVTGGAASCGDPSAADEPPPLPEPAEPSARTCEILEFRDPQNPDRAGNYVTQEQGDRMLILLGNDSDLLEREARDRQFTVASSLIFELALTGCVTQDGQEHHDYRCAVAAARRACDDWREGDPPPPEPDPPDDPVIGSDDDGYWSWLLRHMDANARRQQRINEIRAELSMLASATRRHRGRWMELMRAEMQLQEPGGESIRAEDYYDPERAAPGRQLLASLAGERDLLRTRINDQRNQQRDLINEAVRLHDGMLSTTREQRDRSGTRRPQLDEAVRRLEDESKVLRLSLLDAAEWYEGNGMSSLIEELRAEGASPELTTMLDAKIRLAEVSATRRRAALQRMSPASFDTPPTISADVRRSQFEAIRSLRRVIEVNPENVQAAELLEQVELELLRLIAMKIESERKVSLADMRAYLENRGFYGDGPQSTWQGVKEYVGLVWGTGPITLTLASWMGAPDANATSTAIAQESIAKNLISMVLIQRLRENGLQLPQIRNLTPELMADKYVLRDGSGRPLPEETARRMTRDVRETFIELADLRALVDADADAFEWAFGSAYYDRIDAEQSWGEYLGDALSPRHLITTFGPFAIAKVGGRWAVSGRMTSAQITAAAESGELVRGGEWLVGAMRLDELGKRLAATGYLDRLQRLAAADRAAVEALSGLDAWANSATRLAAAVVLGGGASYLAGESGIPGLQLLVNAVLEIGAADLVYDALWRSGMPAQRLSRRLDEMADELLARSRALDRLDPVLDDLNRMADEVAAGAPGTRARIAGELAEHRPSVRSAPDVPDNPEQAVRHSTDRAMAALEAGDPAEARRALAAAREARNEAKEQLEEEAARAARARRLIDDAPPARPRTPPDEVPGAPTQKLDEASPEAFLATEIFDDTPTGAFVRDGDARLRRGDFEGAAEAYEMARRQELRAAGSGADDITRQRLDGIRERIGLAMHAEDALRQVAAARAGTRQAAHEALTDTEVRDAVGEVAGGRARRLGEDASGRNATFATEVGGKSYFVKELGPNEARAEVAATRLARLVGIDVPGVHAVSARLPDGRETNYLVSRAVDGTLLGEGPAHLTLAMRQEYARQRAFRAWIGDSDGHLGNQLLGSDGRLWQIDFDMASFDGSKLRQLGDLEFDSQDDLLRAALGLNRGSAGVPAITDQNQQMFRDHYLRAIDANRVMDSGAARRMRWVTRMDEMIGLDDMRAQIDRIAALDRGRIESTLADIGLPAGAADALLERAQRLRQVLEEHLQGARVGALRPPGDAAPRELLAA